MLVFTIESGGLGFGGANPPIDPLVLDFEGGDLPPTVKVIGSDSKRFRSD